ncbi:hypothetical protein BOS5A_110430 [Bosea sp. EC-HK365B]|nr:hypothetical protein BOSE21B_50019 [Bosea sp. 21B]CAD5301823.1 hypothetical protein BOSE7B_90669 [Bosea sp. 7B]VVT51729.1 hypothetical protein BOS5A_110430 [Bosea sp. EC-HK365B]VXB78543.1 hypothetical protein BOSE127_140613 [Bosea sp. 127]
MADSDGLAHSYRTGKQHYFGLARR